MSSRVALLLVCLQLAGCPKDEIGIELQFRAFSDLTKDCDPAATTTTPLSKYTVRVSFLRRKGKASGSSWAYEMVNAASLGSYELVCDRVFPASGKGTVDIVVPIELSGTRYTVQLEAFAPDGTLAYTAQDDIDLTQAFGVVHLRPVAGNSHSGLTCFAEPDVRRAFHSATALPDGGVLIAGGLVADTGAGQSSTIEITATQRVPVNTTGTVEVYDAVTRKFLQVGQLKQRRAFHSAFLLPSPPAGPYEILLLGGVTAKSGGAPEGVWLRGSDENLRPFLFSPHDNAEPATAELISYAPGRDGIAGTFTTKLLPDLPRPLFPNAALTANGLGVLGTGGGASHKPAYSTTGGPLSDRGFPQPDIKPYFINLQKPSDKPSYRGEVLPSLVGAAIARLDDTRYLLVGGNMTNGTADTGQKLPGPGVAGTVAPFSEGSHTAWHTLTPIGDPANRAVLWAGGYILEDDAPSDQRRARPIPREAPLSSALQWIDKDYVLRDVPLTVTGSFSPAGYHDAVRLADGAVLLVGGNGSCGQKALCPIAQLATYIWDATTLAPKLLRASGQLHTPRLGHRATRLVDGSVLITGGFNTVIKVDPDPKVPPKEFPALLRSSELYNPRTGQLEDDPFGRAPGKDSGKKQCKLRADVTPP